MGKQIVVCDDAEFMRVALRDILTKEGYEVAGIAKDGLEACQLYKEINPDLLIVDITMPKMDGVETLTEIRKIDKDAAVVMCSAQNQPQTIINALQAGASDFIIKPFQPKRVLEVVRSVIGRP